MTPRICLFLACSVLLSVPPALAQSNQPTRVRARPGKPKPAVLTIDSWEPKQGKVGTAVTIRGRGFTGQTRLLVGGRPVQPSAVKSTWLRFSIPDSYGDGAIVLRHPGVARDIVIGTFAVIEDLAVERITPSAGSPGTRVEIRGAGFKRGDRVVMNGRPIEINTLTERRIVVTIPLDAGSDYLTVTRDGVRARSPGQFSVRLPAPVIAALDPWSGMPGSKVRITGQHFTPADDVYWGRQKLPVVARGTGWVEVEIPRNARGPEYLSVRNGNGQARAPRKFTLERPLLVRRFTPAYGGPGQTVQIYGANFSGGDQVTLAGVPLQVVQILPRQITARIPPGASSGKIAVVRGGYEVAAPRAFQVIQAPVLSGWSPKAGRWGAEITITGDHFTADAAVYYGARKLRIERRRGDRELVVKIPPRVGSEVLSVRTRGGQVVTRTPFEVQVFPEITRAAPLRGFQGTRVNLRGTNLVNVGAVYLGSVSLPIVSRSPRAMVVEVPAGASDEWLYVESYGQRIKSRYRFDVLAASGIDDVKPWSAVPGGDVVITGRDFTRATKVYFGARELQVVRRALPSQLVVRIPPRGVAGVDYLYVEDYGQKARSARTFRVVRQMVVSKYWPETVKPGMELTITGEYFTPASKVYIGKGEVAVIRRSDKQLVVRVPDKLPAGRHPVRVRDDYGEVRLPRPLVVRSSSRLANFLPKQVEPGGAIVIEGDHFTGDTRVYWGDIELRILSRSRAGNKLTVTIPDNAPKDKRWLYVDEYGVRSRSKVKLDVFLPPERRTRVRDKRKPKPRPRRGRKR